MHRVVYPLIATTLLASILNVGSALADDAAAPAAQAPAAQPAPPAPAGKITKSRSNIQNNRAAPPASDDPATSTGSEPTEVVKTKTKSNQSND